MLYACLCMIHHVSTSAACLCGAPVGHGVPNINRRMITYSKTTNLVLLLNMRLGFRSK